MGVLLDSSWMRFGPAGRGTEARATRSPSTPGEEAWESHESGETRSLEFVLSIILPVISLLLLLLLLLALIRRCCCSSKLSLANIITLDLQDTESSAEFLASLTRNAERHPSTTSDGSDGVFVMVYLSPPYEETLTKITRAASLSSSKTVEAVKIKDLEAAPCSELKSMESD